MICIVFLSLMRPCFDIYYYPNAGDYELYSVLLFLTTTEFGRKYEA